MKVSSPPPPRWVLDDPVNISRFQWVLKDYVFDLHGNIDLEVSRWTNTVQTAQRHAFPVPPVRSRKPWISHHSWLLIRHTARCRSVMRRWQHWTRGFTTHVWFSLWRLATTCSHPTVSDSDLTRVGSLALCSPGPGSERSEHSLPTMLKDKSLRYDRQASLEQFAHRAAAPLQSVFARDGTLLTEADNIRDCWRQHHAEVLGAIIVPSPFAQCPFAIPHTDDVDMVRDCTPLMLMWPAFWLVLMAIKHLDRMESLPLSCVLEDMLCCASSTPSFPLRFLSVGFLFPGEVAGWSTCTRKVTPKTATTGEGCMLVTTLLRFSPLSWLNS